MLWELVKKYWDIFGGIITGVVLSLLAQFKLDVIQLYYSIIILCLVSIGIFKIIKQEVGKRKRKKVFIDNMVDVQKSMKAISIAQNPTKDGEDLGKILIKIWGKIKKRMEKLKTFWSKFKGYLFTIALAVLTVVEYCGGYINELCGGVLIYNDIEILPIITLGATTIVGVLSNGYTKEQREKIKALFTKSSTNKLVTEEIKKSLKDNEAKLKEYKKILTTQENALSNLNVELERVKNTHAAKIEMYNMTPRLATLDDVNLSRNEVINIEREIVNKNGEIADTKARIDVLNTTIAALKSQL